MFCSSCGVSMTKKSRFCRQCGSEVNPTEDCEHKQEKIVNDGNLKQTTPIAYVNNGSNYGFPLLVLLDNLALQYFSIDMLPPKIKITLNPYDWGEMFGETAVLLLIVYVFSKLSIHKKSVFFIIPITLVFIYIRYDLFHYVLTIGELLTGKNLLSLLILNLIMLFFESAALWLFFKNIKQLKKI